GQVDAQPAVAEDVVAQHGVAHRGRVNRAGPDDDALAGVEVDEVAGPRSRAADQVVGRAALDEDAREVGQGAAGDADADAVALHRVPRGARTAEVHADTGVGGDDVAETGTRPAGQVVMRPARDEDPGGVGDGGRAGGVGADEVAVDGVAAGRRPGDNDSGDTDGGVVAGDDVAGPHAADQVLRRVEDPHAEGAQAGGG